VPASMMGTATGAEYAIKWINGEVPKDSIDYDVLSRIMADYVNELTGESVDITLAPYEEDGVTYDNFLLNFIDSYLTY